MNLSKIALEMGRALYIALTSITMENDCFHCPVSCNRIRIRLLYTVLRIVLYFRLLHWSTSILLLGFCQL